MPGRPLHFAGIADLVVFLLAEDGRFVGVMLEFKEIVGGVFQEKSVVFDARARESDARVLVKAQPFGFRSISERLPFLLYKKNQTEMARIDTFLFRGLIRHEMANELMARQAERDRLFRSPSDGTPEPIHVESDSLLQVVDRESEMEQTLSH